MRVVGGLRSRGARGCGAARQVACVRRGNRSGGVVLAVGEGRYRGGRRAASCHQLRCTLSSGELERPERPEPSTYEREVPELIQEPAFDVSSQDSEAVNAFRTVDDKNPEAVRKDLELARAYLQSEKKISMPILRLNKAGVVCKFSDALEAFVPVAQLSSYTRQFYREEWVGFGSDASVLVERRKQKKGKSLVGENIDVCVIGVRDEADEGFGQKHMVVMSEKKAEEIGASEIFDVTERGDVVECYVKTVTHFGIFVKLGAIDALIHKSQVWLPEMEEQGEDIMIDEAKLSSNFSLGDRLQAVVIKADREKGQISLSMKALVPNRSKLSLSEIAQEMKNITTKNEDWVIPEMVQLASTLGEMGEIEEIIPGPCVKSGAVAPDFQVLLSSKELEGEYEVFARKGFQVQEARVKTALGRSELKVLLQNVSSRAA
ncbi:S1 motif domain-containing protein [Chloropicon primus]|uniref:S1 motif domain-containing protein n=1 Tax=Chloropicon primus TaxID=1764295 RepID=A0A5B8ME99_9CHLO|nr:hypothetical protein A3770_02p14440 [Chloropicon primus]UPQ98134.1 S1 motif domain-containing protein [Chloropicon primus]|eukprot:QDZ18926.1 hypothetical protein A3770_02p14440 [Chloropicon primus]